MELVCLTLDYDCTLSFPSVYTSFLKVHLRLCVQKRRKRQNEVLSKLASKLSTENTHGIGQNI